MSLIISQSAPNIMLASASALVQQATIGTNPKALLSFTGYNADSSTRYAQIHDSAVNPVVAGAPVISIVVPATTSFSWGIYVPITPGRYLIVALSTTQFTYTAIGSNQLYYTVQYAGA